MILGRIVYTLWDKIAEKLTGTDIETAIIDSSELGEKTWMGKSDIKVCLYLLITGQ